MAAADDRVKAEIAAEKEEDISEAAKKIRSELPTYKQTLEMLTNDPNIKVLMNRARINDKTVEAVIIQFSSESSRFCHYLKTEIEAYPGVQFSPRVPLLLFVAIAELPRVLAVIDWEVEKQFLFSKIDAEILRLQTPQTFSFLITPSNYKIERLNDLERKVREAKFQPGKSLATVVELWEQTEVKVKNLSSGAIETKTNGQLLGTHRNSLSRAFFEEEATETSEFLTMLKAGPK